MTAATGRGETLSRALLIMEAVADMGTGTTAREIARRVGLPQASAYRLLNNLVADQYLVRTTDLRGFGLGTRVSDIVSAAVTPSVSTRARELIEDFRETVRFGVHVVYFRQYSVRIIDADPDHPINGERALRRYLHASAPGKILLASMSEWRQVVGAVPPRVTPETITDVARLSEEINQVRRTDLAVDNSEFVVGDAHVAVPVFDATGQVCGAVMISGVPGRLDAMVELQAPAKEMANGLGPLIF